MGELESSTAYKGSKVNWRDAFIRQAKSEQRVREKLNSPEIEYSHQLHYLQMVAEKVAKAYLTHPNDANAPEFVHHGFVRLLQTLKSRSDIRRKLGFDNLDTFRKYIKSLLVLAEQVERLAPSAAGANQPNPEYPWRNPNTGSIIAPVDFDFPLFSVKNPRMIKLEHLLNKLLDVFV